MIWLVLVLGSVGLGWLLGEGNASANLRAAAERVPEHLMMALLGVTTGLYRRDRVRLRRTYASPTLAYLGKGILFGAVAAEAAAVFTPLAWPGLWHGLFPAAAAAGLSLWLGNLPWRL